MPMRCLIWRREGLITAPELREVQEFGRILHHFQVISALVVELLPGTDIVALETYCWKRDLGVEGVIEYEKNRNRKEAKHMACTHKCPECNETWYDDCILKAVTKTCPTCRKGPKPSGR